MDRNKETNGNQRKPKECTMTIERVCSTENQNELHSTSAIVTEDKEIQMNTELEQLKNNNKY